jgi:hypothetical protein
MPKGRLVAEGRKDVERSKPGPRAAEICGAGAMMGQLAFEEK